MANEKGNLQDLLMAALQNHRPPTIGSAPTASTAFGTSPTDQLLKLVTFATNHDVESDNAKSLAHWEDRERKMAAAINETIQQADSGDE